MHRSQFSRGIIMSFEKDDRLISHIELRMVDLVHELVVCGVLTSHQMIEYVYDKINETLIEMEKLA